MSTIQSLNMNNFPGSGSGNEQESSFWRALQWHYPSDAHHPIAGIQFPESGIIPKLLKRTSKSALRGCMLQGFPCISFKRAPKSALRGCVLLGFPCIRVKMHQNRRSAGAFYKDFFVFPSKRPENRRSADALHKDSLVFPSKQSSKPVLREFILLVFPL